MVHVRHLCYSTEWIMCSNKLHHTRTSEMDRYLCHHVIQILLSVQELFRNVRFDIFTSRITSSGRWHVVVLLVVHDVLKDCGAFIKEVGSLTLKIKAMWSFIMSDTTWPTICITFQKMYVNFILSTHTNTEEIQMKTLYIFYLVIYWKQRAHNDFICLFSLHCIPYKCYSASEVHAYL
jgi:hypothetical protein